MGEGRGSHCGLYCIYAYNVHIRKFWWCDVWIFPVCSFSSAIVGIQAEAGKCGIINTQDVWYLHFTHQRGAESIRKSKIIVLTLQAWGIIFTNNWLRQDPKVNRENCGSKLSLKLSNLSLSLDILWTVVICAVPVCILHLLLWAGLSPGYLCAACTLAPVCYGRPLLLCTRCLEAVLITASVLSWLVCPSHWNNLLMSAKSSIWQWYIFWRGVVLEDINPSSLLLSVCFSLRHS